MRNPNAVPALPGRLLVCLLMLVAWRVEAQEPLPLDDVDQHRLERSDGVEQRLWIRRPPGDWPKGRRFRTVYLLDADYSFLLARNLTQHLSERSHLEPLLLVGVGYADQDDSPSLTDPRARDSYRANRSRDYTPWRVREGQGGYGAPYDERTGGAGTFADWLRDELIPWVEEHYPVDGDRTIVGHSYGGLFASWLLLERPTLFHRYVIVSPSLWYADERIYDRIGVRAESLAAATKPHGMRVHLGVGALEVSGRWDMPELLIRFAQRLDALQIPGLDVRHRVWPDETHNSIFPAALSTGLRAVHDGR